MHDTRPGQIMLRADRILSRSDWLGQNYILFYDDTESILRVLDAVPVALVILDTSVPEKDWRPHHELLRNALIESVPDWTPIASIDVIRNGTLYEQALEIYRRNGDVAVAVVTFENVFGDTPKPFVSDEVR